MSGNTQPKKPESATVRGQPSVNKTAKDGLNKAKQYWDKYVGSKGGPLIWTMFQLLMFHWYGETAVIGALVAFFKPELVTTAKPHYEKALHATKQLKYYVWLGALAFLSLLYLFEPKDSHYFESVMTIVNLFCYIVAAQVGADLAKSNLRKTVTVTQ